MARAAEFTQQRFLGGEDIGRAGRVAFRDAKLGGGLFQQRILIGGFGAQQDLPDAVTRAGGQD